jgi:hypothetical protein
MNERREARALARHLDRLLQSQESAGPSGVAPGRADAELTALGELGNSLASIQFMPRPAHQAAFEHLLRQYRPTLPPGGSTVPFAPGGVPLFSILATAVLLLGTLVFSRSLAPAPVQSIQSPTHVPGRVTVPVQAPVQPLTRTLPARPWQAPTATLTPTFALAATITPTATMTSTATVTPTATITLTATTTPTGTVTPRTNIPPAIPRAIDVPPTGVTSTLEAGQVGLAFHPEHLNTGGVCRTIYLASGSLKNHGPGRATDIDIVYTVAGGEQWVDRIEISPSSWTELETSKPGRFTIYVHTNRDWPSAGKGTEIVVQLNAGGDAQATFSVKNQCKPAKPDEPKPDKPDEPKPDKPNEPDKQDKPKKQGRSSLQ